MPNIAKYTKALVLKLTLGQFKLLQDKAKELETSVNDVVRRLLKFIDKI